VVLPRGLRTPADREDEADERLADAEGHGLEKLVGALYEERSRKRLAGFRLSQRVQGFSDRGGTEIDLVALDEEDRTVRLGSCRRSAERLAPDYERSDRHVARFLALSDRVRGWRVEKAAIAMRHDRRARVAAERAGYIPQDLDDLIAGS
jgi:hypothetical protein